MVAVGVLGMTLWLVPLLLELGAEFRALPGWRKVELVAVLEGGAGDAVLWRTRPLKTPGAGGEGRERLRWRTERLGISKPYPEHAYVEYVKECLL